MQRNIKTLAKGKLSFTKDIELIKIGRNFEVIKRRRKHSVVPIMLFKFSDTVKQFDVSLMIKTCPVCTVYLLNFCDVSGIIISFTGS